MVTQAFFYNAVLFTFGLVLLRYYDVPAPWLGLYLVPLALGNFLGPVLVGRLFDTVGRKPMIAATYILSGVPFGRHGVALPGRRPDGSDADALLERRLLRRVVGRERGVPHGE